MTEGSGKLEAAGDEPGRRAEGKQLQKRAPSVQSLRGWRLAEPCPLHVPEAREPPHGVWPFSSRW